MSLVSSHSWNRAVTMDDSGSTVMLKWLKSMCLHVGASSSTAAHGLAGTGAEVTGSRMSPSSQFTGVHTGSWVSQLASDPTGNGAQCKRHVAARHIRVLNVSLSGHPTSHASYAILLVPSAATPNAGSIEAV